ncbi:copper amine oxidase N-terminal domain-containing protein [Paenibacillus doosanensis]|uniref:copper amine oxidase N-terminal domain-containing protein n=1 Tax=Paenibacillus doosanensis TaxID=1229154 RepID=UPI00217F9A6E|nr:copper amine oxidase N-terminal domain-containing protein [Paenibacillus doosanensis]MCS7459070.1 copper amine oxidase N-terminal domain-containing protein [Paenibacillus doosanensis]
MPWLRKIRLPQLALFVSMLLPFDLPVHASAQDAVQIYLFQEKVQWEQQPYIEQGNTMVPMRSLFEKLGFTVEWDPGTQTATAVKGDLTLSLTVSKATAAVNQTQYNLEVAPQIKDGSTFIPLRFVSEASGSVVSWDEAARTVHIDTPADDPQQKIHNLIDNITQSSSFTQMVLAITDGDGIKKNEVNITDVALGSDGLTAKAKFQVGFTVSKAVKKGNGVTISPSETALYEFTCDVYKDKAGQWLLSSPPASMKYELVEKKPFMDAS